MIDFLKDTPRLVYLFVLLLFSIVLSASSCNDMNEPKAKKKRFASEIVIKEIQSKRNDEWTDDSYELVNYWAEVSDSDVNTGDKDFMFVDTLGKFKVGDRVKIEFSTIEKILQIPIERHLEK